MTFGFCITLLLFTSTTHAFQTNCTLPTERTAYVSSPNTRGTTDILWTCLATIFACTYTVLHLNVPEPRLGRDPGWKGDLKWSLKGLWSNLKWTLTTIIAPELILMFSYDQMSDARHRLRRMHAKWGDVDRSWTLSHMFYANMGGFALRGHTESGMEGLCPLTAPSLFALYESGEIEPNVPISADDLNDKSKSDVVGKSLAILQIGYFLVVVLERAANHLTTTQLELGVCGFVGCSVAIYATWFYKPKSVQSVMILKQYNGQIPEKVVRVVQSAHKDFKPWLSSTAPGSRIRNDFDYAGADCTTFFLLPLVAAALGAVHLAGWHFSFPSRADAWIWRGAGIASTVALPLLIVIMALLDALPDTPGIETVLTWPYWALPSLYALSRLVLMVEMFRCLFYLPPDAYKATSWAMSIPHIG